MANTRVFVVSGDPAIRDSLSELIASAGLRAETFSSFEAWLDSAQSSWRGCLLLDARTWDVAGPERLARLTASGISLPVLLLVDRGDVPTAVRAIKDGVADVLEKPLRDGHLLERIKMAVAATTEADAG
jgi:two-component system response regulator FixJ